jgi:hypothetical protein
MRYLTFLYLVMRGFVGWGLVWGQSLYFPPLTGQAWDTLSPLTLGWNRSQVATLWEGVSEPGKQQVVFNAERLPAGVYLCALRAGTHETRRLLVRGAGL